MPILRAYRGFISHAWDYSDEYYRLEKMLAEYPNFDWANYSVPKTNPLETKTDSNLEGKLYNQIQPTNHVIIIAGMYANHRKWIQKEIDIAKSYGKPIIAIRPWNSERIPVEVQNSATVIVGWNAAPLVQAIRNAVTNRQAVY